jgi:hypothetical protein
MRIQVMCAALFLFSGLLSAQQPVPMGKIDNSSRNYNAGDGTTLDKHSSDEVVARAVQQSLSNDPELSDVQVQVKHHRVTLRGIRIYQGSQRTCGDDCRAHRERTSRA